MLFRWFTKRALCFCPTVLMLFALCVPAERASALDRLAPWRKGVKIRPVFPGGDRHSVHSYQNVLPESPDGRWILMYTSTTAEGHRGEICIVERATGKVVVLAKGVTVQDIHRVAAQQWVSGGRRVIYHDLRDGEWVIACVDMETRTERVLAKGRQLGMSPAGGNLVPICGLHWDPKDHKDIEILDVETGEIRTAITIGKVREDSPGTFKYLEKRLPGKPMSLFFPILSPDLKRVIFKLSVKKDGKLRSHKASRRIRMFCYDLASAKLLHNSKWAHPAWHPDSETIIRSYGGTMAVVNCLKERKARLKRKLPKFPSSHPTFGPTGRLFTTDTKAAPFGGAKNQWAIVVGDLETEEYVIVHKFDNSKGATSWRRSHPHPIFNADGKRIYFNVSAKKWTQLYVAEAAGPAVGDVQGSLREGGVRKETVSSVKPTENSGGLP